MTNHERAEESTNERQARHLICDCSNFGNHLPESEQHSKSCYYRTEHGSRLVETLTMTLDDRDKRHAAALHQSEVKGGERVVEAVEEPFSDREIKICQDCGSVENAHEALDKIRKGEL